MNVSPRRRPVRVSTTSTANESGAPPPARATVPLTRPPGAIARSQRLPDRHALAPRLARRRPAAP
jgi:hypothetical protein